MRFFIVSMMCILQLGVNLSSSLVFFCKQHAFSLADPRDSLSAYKLCTITQVIFQIAFKHITVF